MIAAIVPAAGLSQRMGEPKLLLPIGGIPVIARVIEALLAGGVDRALVITPPESVGHTRKLTEIVRCAARRRSSRNINQPI